MTKLVSACIVTLAVACLHAQAPAAPAIQGSVSDQQGRALPDVRVLLFPADASTWSSPDAARFPASPVTNGVYQFGQVPPGNYRLTVVAASSLDKWPTQEMIARLAPRAFPVMVQSSPLSFDLIVNMTGTSPGIVSVGAAATTTGRITSRGAAPGSRGVAPPLPRATGPAGTGAASGRVFDADNRPVSGVEVRIYSYRVMNGVSQLVMAMAPGSVKTDQHGAYRFTGLRPGAYFIGVPAHVFVSQGPGLTGSNGLPASSPQPDGTKLGYDYTFYPSATKASEAREIRIDAGERRELDVTLQRQTLVDVAGRISGGRALVAVSLAPADAAGSFGGSNQRRVPPAPDGSFVFSDVPRGEYTISAIGVSGAVRSTVRITGPLAEPLDLSMRPGIQITGRVTFSGAPPPVVTPPDPFRLGVRLVPIGQAAGMHMVPILPSGEFRFNSVQPGRYRLEAVLPTPWRQVSGVLDGVDTLDSPVEIETGAAPANATVAAIAGDTLLQGIVRRDGAPASPTAAIVVFSEDEAFWTAGSRRVRVAHPGPSGSYAVAGLPPGRYLAAAVERGPVNAQAVAPEFLRSLASRAVTVEVGAGAPSTSDLTIGPSPAGDQQPPSSAGTTPRRAPPTTMGPPPPLVTSARELWNQVPIMVVGRVAEMPPPRVERGYVLRDASVEVIEMIKRGPLPAQLAKLTVRFFGGEATVDGQTYSTDALPPSNGEEMLLFLNANPESDVYRLASYRYVSLRPGADGGINLAHTHALREFAGMSIVTREAFLAVFRALNAH